MPSPVATIADILRRRSTATPERTALLSEGRRVSWRELADAAGRVANGLLAHGLASQDRVAILTRNAPAYFEALFGAAMCDTVTVPVNWRLAPAELIAVLNDSRARILIAEPGLLGGIDRLADLRHVERILILGDGASALGDARAESYEDWRDRHPSADPLASAPASHVVAQIYTSGTTGAPKGVMLTHRNVAGFLEGWRRYRFSEASVNLVALPLFHIGGLWWAILSLAAGGVTLLQREFDPGEALSLISEHRVTHALLVPAALLALTQSKAFDTADVSSVRVIMYGASPISEDLLERCLASFPADFYQTYGMTETSGAVTVLGPEEHRRREALRSAGRPMSGVELKVVDPETLQALPPDSPGEVWVRSDQVMAGYWGKPEETRQVLLPDGWLRTGDIGLIADGRLILHDRLKDMIVSGGENVYPAEVENVLMSHPLVADVAIIGVPSQRWGEEVKAIVVPTDGARIDPAELLAFARERLAGYKAPKSIDWADQLPRNPSGKLLKKELRRPYWADRDRHIG